MESWGRAVVYTPPRFREGSERKVGGPDAFPSSRATGSSALLSEAVAASGRGEVEAFVEGYCGVEVGDGVLAGGEVLEWLPCRVRVAFPVHKVVEAVTLPPEVGDVVDFVDVGVIGRNGRWEGLAVGLMLGRAQTHREKSQRH